MVCIDVIDIHYRKKRLESSIRRLKKNRKISKANKELILKFKDDCFAEELSVDRVQFYIQRLTNIALWLNKDFKKTRMEDLKRVNQQLQLNEKYTPWTKCCYRVSIKKFYKWLGLFNKDDLRWLKTKPKNNHEKLPSELLTKDDINKLIQNAENNRDKAFISTLYESGCRIGELLNLRIKDIEFIKNGCKITVQGKTGSRRLLLITSARFLANWLNQHPKKDDKNALVWINLMYNRSKDMPVSYARIKIMLKKTAKKSKINKPINPHHFRHSICTQWAGWATEQQMKKYFGWSKSSDMPGIYTHLSGRDIDNAILSYHGLKEEEKKPKAKPKILEFKICPRCEEKNVEDNLYCSKCACQLNIDYNFSKVKEIEKRLTSKIVKDKLDYSSAKQEILKELKKELREIVKNEVMSELRNKK